MVRKFRFAFLYYHEALHQIPHSAPIINGLMQTNPDCEITVFYTHERQRALVEKIVDPDHLDQIQWEKLALAPLLGVFLYIINLFGPVYRLAILHKFRKKFTRFDALIVNENTTHRLRRLYKMKRPFLVNTGHGSGDRSITFRDVRKYYDLQLISGPKVQSQYEAHGLLRPGGYAQVGFLKCEAIKAMNGKRPRLFDNDRPIILYNPHFDPYLSSWYKMGIDILNFFANNRDYNLIVAPHVMLFKRIFQASVEHIHFSFVRPIPKKYYDIPNIHIDTSSDALIDMTYTQMADIYMGDVSSQVYEFLVKPRPCLFLNCHNANWQGNPYYRFWSYGTVIDRTADLKQELAATVRDHNLYLEKQRKQAEETYGRVEHPSLTAAQAIITRLEALEESSAHPQQIRRWQADHTEHRRRYDDPAQSSG